MNDLYTKTVTRTHFSQNEERSRSMDMRREEKILMKFALYAMEKELRDRIIQAGTKDLKMDIQRELEEVQRLGYRFEGELQ